MHASRRAKDRAALAILKHFKKRGRSLNKKQLANIAKVYKLNGGMGYHHRHAMSGGSVGEDLQDFGSDMWTKFTNKVSDFQDVPEMNLGKLGSGVDYAAEHAAKYGLAGPASGIRDIVDTVSGNNVNRMPLSVFDHPGMETRNL